jgi:hypothetical protein
MHLSKQDVEPKIVLDEVSNALEHGRGLTSAELARATGNSRYQMAGLLPDAERAGLALRGRVRKCRISGKPALTWLPLVEASE